MVYPLNSSSNVKASIFYVNDIHGQMPNMERITVPSKFFDTFKNSTQTDTFKFSSGDILIGENKKRNQSAVKFLEINDFDAITLGNHEFDTGVKLLSEFLSNTKMKILGMNMNIPQNSDLKNKISRSLIMEKNGNKYGLIGLEPTDMNVRIRSKDLMNGITIDDFNQTKKELQEEVVSLQKQGINKIFLLSHLGSNYDKQIAKEVSGIDVILGGHSHHLIKDIKQDENLFYSPTKEPVILTQAGKDGDYFGVLNIEFNPFGRIIKAQNNVASTQKLSKNLVMTTINNIIHGKSNEVANLKYVEIISPETNMLKSENPYGNFICDAMRIEMNADVAFMNPQNLRGELSLGKVTQRDITSLTPFENKLVKVELSEPELVSTLKFYSKSLGTIGKSAGILQVSGLNYVVNKRGELKELYFIDKKGSKIKIDINNPNKDKKYIAVYDSFVASSDESAPELRKDRYLKNYDFDKDMVAGYHAMKLGDFEIKKDGRIKIID